MTEDVNEVLKRYLIETQLENRKISKLAEKLEKNESHFDNNVKAIFDGQARLTNHVALLTQKFDHVVESYNERFKGVESRLTKLEERGENTGRHDVSLLQKQLEDYRKRDAEEASWWARNRVTLLISALGFCLTTFIGVILAVILKKG